MKGWLCVLIYYFSDLTMKVKPVVYQILPRLFGNKNKSLVPNGNIE